MKLIELYNTESLYNKLSSRTDLPIKLVYKLTKFFEVVNKEAEFYREELAKILNEYAERDEDGKVATTDDGLSIKIKKDCLTVCEEKLQELANLEVEAPDIKFSMDELPEGLSVQELSYLMPFIEE